MAEEYDPYGSRALLMHRASNIGIPGGSTARVLIHTELEK